MNSQCNNTNMYYPPKNNLEYSQQRLDGILSRRRLCFNPYTVSDERLLEIAQTTGWGGDLDITEIVTLHFTRMREVKDFRQYDGIYMTIGESREEIYVPLGALKNPITANDTIQPERTWVGKKPIRNVEDVISLVGKTYFVSRKVRGVNIRGENRVAYRMHRIIGKVTRDASTIREAMCAAKIEMLERILANPQSRDYLDCRKGFFDYETRLRLAIEIISKFHGATPESH